MNLWEDPDNELWAVIALIAFVLIILHPWITPGIPG